MLLFRSEENIAKWCQAEQMPRGEILNLEQVWQLSKLWYSNRLLLEYAGRSAQEVKAIFDRVGLSDPFWQL